MVQTWERKHVLVIGGGFGGLAVIRGLKQANVDITLLDKANHHLFQPLLYQVATTGLAAPDIAQPLRSILSRQGNVTVLMEKAESIDLAAKKVKTNKRELGFDTLVIAAGATTSYFGNDHWEAFAPGLKSLSDARKIRHRVLEAFEEAESSDCDPVATQRLMTMVVAGGGPTGVEIAGALAELTKRVMKGDFTRINSEHARIVLIEGEDQVLPSYPKHLGESAQAQLEALGVEVLLGLRVKDIRKDTVELDDGTIIEAATICWTAGMGANPLTQTLDVPKDRGGRIEVEPDCSVPGHPEVFAIGDIIRLQDANGVPVPGVAQGAIQAGAHVASIIRHEQAGHRERPPFKYSNRGEMATIGRSKAVALIKGYSITGFFAWVLWLTIHLAFLVGLRNRIVVTLNWFFSYVFYNPGARIIWELDAEEKNGQSKP